MPDEHPLSVYFSLIYYCYEAPFLLLSLHVYQDPLVPPF